MFTSGKLHQVPVDVDKTRIIRCIYMWRIHSEPEYKIAKSRAEELIDSSYPVSADKMAKPRAIGSGSTMLSDVGTKQHLKYSMLCVGLGR